jgi:hypothetical protein
MLFWIETDLEGQETNMTGMHESCLLQESQWNCRRFVLESETALRIACYHCPFRQMV